MSAKADATVGLFTPDLVQRVCWFAIVIEKVAQAVYPPFKRPREAIYVSQVVQEGMLE